jgi:hypothetical protein
MLTVTMVDILMVKDILRDILMVRVSYILAADIPGKVKDLERMVTVGGDRGMTPTFDRTWVHKSLILVLYRSLSRLDGVKGK